VNVAKGGAWKRALQFQQTGLVAVILLLSVLLTLFAGTRTDRVTGQSVNNFLNPGTLMQVATDTSFFAIMAIGATVVIISGGIDLSVGSTYALCGVLMAMALGRMGDQGAWLGPIFAVALGGVCGFLNGVMVSRLGVHPFVITLGSMWVFRGIAFVSSEGNSILTPPGTTAVAKATFGLSEGLYPVPMLVMLAAVLAGTAFLGKTVTGRRIYAIGGNAEAARYAGIRIPAVLTGVYVISGLAAGLAAWLGTAYYGAASSADGTGYELYVIASAVVGGTSLNGGKGAAWGAFLGALLIVLIRQSIRTFGLDQNYEWIVIGVAIVAAVVLDRTTAKAAERRLLMARET
jgi:ribose transport system permease protein